MLFVSVNVTIAGRKHYPMDSKKGVGNVCGYVFDRDNHKPIQGAEVYLFSPDLDPQAGIEQVEQQISFSGIPFRSKRVTNERGRFLINFVPTPDDHQEYALLVTANGYQSEFVNRFTVPSGFSDRPEFTFSLQRGSSELNIITSADLSLILSYGTNNAKLKPDSTRRSVASSGKNVWRGVSTVQATIYSTKEYNWPDDSGGVTKNGHIITAPDEHWCALPDSSVLCANDSTNGSDFTVTIYYGKNEQDNVPVWDRGPWNYHDNYWDPESQRYIDNYLIHGGQPGLGQYVPEAEAAFDWGYDSSYSEPVVRYPNGQRPNLPNGIDFALGTFNDLSIPPKLSDYVGVVFNWQGANSTINEDIKQGEDWFDNVTITASVHINTAHLVDVDSGCVLTLNANVRLIIDSGSTLKYEKGVITHYGSGAGITLNGGTFDSMGTVVPVCQSNCPPQAPYNFSLKIVGQDVQLTWGAITDPGTWGINVIKNGQLLRWLTTSATSYTDTGATTQLTVTQPLRYSIQTFNGSNPGILSSQQLNVYLSPSSIASYTVWQDGAVLIKSNVTVASGVQLLITPSMTVYVNPGHNYSLTINGAITLRGTTTNPITFTSNGVSPSPGDWYGIRLRADPTLCSTVISATPPTESSTTTPPRTCWRSTRSTTASTTASTTSPMPPEP